MFGLVVQNFASAATGVVVVAVVARAFAAHRGEGLGNCWRDLVRVTLYVLLPFSARGSSMGTPRVHALIGAPELSIASYPTATVEALRLCRRLVGVVGRHDGGGFVGGVLGNDLAAEGLNQRRLLQPVQRRRHL